MIILHIIKMKYHLANDERLVQGLHENDQEAFNEIFHRFFDKLISIAYNHVRDKYLAEDVVQEIFIRLWERRSDIKIDSLSAYLGMSVKYNVLNAVQRQKRHAVIIDRVMPSTSANFDNEIYARFLQQYIDGVVEELPVKCQNVFKYSRNEGKTIPEIAAMLQISEKTVEAHITKALKAVRMSLKQTGIIHLLVFLLKILNK